ncbi:hypothetical protein TREES_T100014756, partial [Tupaia chinensis]
FPRGPSNQLGASPSSPGPAGQLPCAVSSPAAASQRPGLKARMATTAAGVAVGSPVGHMLRMPPLGVAPNILEENSQHPFGAQFWS